jgi:Tol biopolymer transport system component
VRIEPREAKGKRSRRIAAILILTPSLLLMAAGIVWRVAGRTVTRLPGRLRTIQLTTGAGLEHSPSFSADGNQVAYASDRTGSFEIYVRPAIAGGREVRITDDGGQNVHPRYSPDGRQIVYYSARRGAIMIVPALGGFAREVSSFGSEPSFSPDGKWVAFRSGGYVSLGTPELKPPARSRLWIVPAGGGPPRQVTQSSPAGAHGRPSWSPDGKFLLFAAYDRMAELWMVGVDTGKAVRLPVMAGMHFEPVFAPDRSAVYYASGTSDFSFGVWRVRIGKPEPPLELVHTGKDVPVSLAVSPDGRKIIYTLVSMQSKLGSLPVDARGMTADPELIGNDTGLRTTFPAFSPDGNRVAYVVRRQGVESDVYVRDLDGGRAAQVTSSPAPDLLPNWMPDGKSLLYAAGNARGFTLRVVELDTGKERVALDEPMVKIGTRLSPDGKRVVFHRAEQGKPEAWIVELATGKAMKLAEGIEYPCWSRDGKWIAAERRVGESAQLVLVPASGGSVQSLVSHAGQNWPYSFSPDSRRIAFASQRDGVWNLYWVDRVTGKEQQLTANRLVRSYLRYPEWSPKGDRIVHEYAEARGNLFVVELR